MRISVHGKTEGYVLIEAILTIFIVSLVSSILVTGLAVNQKLAKSNIDRTVIAISERGKTRTEYANKQFF